LALSLGPGASSAPGVALAATGVHVDQEAMYLVGNVEHMIWPYDNRDRLLGRMSGRSTNQHAS
jgi:hypothetical protein